MPVHRDDSFPGKYRLRKSNDFRRVFARGRRRATLYFVIYTLPNRLEVSRLGIQVRRKIGTAVTRNKLKRMAREVFRRMKDDFRQSLDIVLVVEKAMAEIRMVQFEIVFRESLQGAL